MWAGTIRVRPPFDETDMVRAGLSKRDRRRLGGHKRPLCRRTMVIAAVMVFAAGFATGAFIF